MGECFQAFDSPSMGGYSLPIKSKKDSKESSLATKSIELIMNRIALSKSLPKSSERTLVSPSIVNPPAEKLVNETSELRVFNWFLLFFLFVFFVLKYLVSLINR